MVLRILSVAIIINCVLFENTPSFGQNDNRFNQARRLILEFCLAGGTEIIEVSQKNGNFSVNGSAGNVSIERRESAGLVGGISKELTVLAAEQATAARDCTQRYLRELLDLILKDDSSGSNVATPRQIPRNRRSGVFEGDAESFWAGKGFWSEQATYCEDIKEFIDAAAHPDSFRFSNSGAPVYINQITSEIKKISGNFFLKTETGSRARFCGVFLNTRYNYPALACARTIAPPGAPELFASVFNQTLKDIRVCLKQAGWRQVGPDVGACLPDGNQRGECIRRWEKGNQDVWLFSNAERDGRGYSMGIQTKIGVSP